MEKKPPANVGNSGYMGSITGSGRSPGEVNGIPRQHSCLKIPWTEKPGGLQPLGSKESNTAEQLGTHYMHLNESFPGCSSQ